MDCTVCCEKFNKTNHFKVECKGCNEKVCRSCCQTFIIEHSHQEPSCMFCKTPWERDFINKNLTKKFVNTSLKNHIENVFLEQEISLLPETQQAARNEKEIRKISNELEKANVRLNKIKKELADQNDIIKAFNLKILRLRTGNFVEENKNNFTHKCKKEECKGFLNNKYTCELCDTNFCSKCLEIKEENHECNEELLATVQAIRKEAKPCPSCGEMISKIDGCDQMWCIKCHVQFSWKTGNQLEGYNHNPEYFRWLRESGQEIARNPGEQMHNVCGIAFDERILVRIIRNFSPRDDNILTGCLAIYRYYRHNENVLRGEQHHQITADNHLKRLRIKYLLNDIDKKSWKENIQKIFKNLNKQKSYNNIKNLISNALHSIIERMFIYQNENNIIEKYKKLLNEADTFRIYINSSFLRISDTYGSTSCPGISPSWVEIGNLKSIIKNNKN